MRAVLSAVISVLLMLFFLCFSGCGLMRKLSSTGPTELPPVVISGVAAAPGDEIPVVKTTVGYVKTPIPGIPVKPSPALEYKTYVGPSD